MSMVNVNVTAKGSDGPVDWEIDGKKAANSTIEFKPKTGPQVIHFMLDDQTGRDLRFDQSDSFWADKNLAAGCPSAGASCDQTTVLSCNDKQLVVRNENSGEPCTVHYQLNFVDAQGNREGADPIIKNGGSA
jgi:hypothetical protein